MKTLLEMSSSKQNNRHRFRKKKINVRITFYDIRLRMTLLQDFFYRVLILLFYGI